MIVSFLSKFRSRSNDPKLPHYLLNHPRNGGGPEQVLLSVERRLRRLYKFTKHDPIELLDDVDQEGLTLRQRIQDPAQLHIVQNLLTRFEERYGSREWLRLGQTIMLFGDTAIYQSEAPELDKRWITLLDPEYPEGGLGPVPLDSGVCVYSHAHGGLLAAVDDNDLENRARLLWYFGSHDDVGPDDAVSVVDGIAKFQLYAHHGPALTLGDDGELGIETGSIYVADVWPTLAVMLKRKEAGLVLSGRFRHAPTADLSVS